MADGNATMPNDDRLDISEIIDLERYPIGELDGSGSRVVRRCRAELAEDGACQLDGFIQPVAAQAVLEEAEILSGKAFRADATNLDADPPYLVFGRTLLGRDHQLVQLPDSPLRERKVRSPDRDLPI